MASLDGINDTKTLILEIKGNNDEFHEMARIGKVPEFHFCQMQWHMFVTDIPECHYLSYRRGDEIIIVIPRDEVFIARMVDEGLKFKEMLDNFIPPPLTDRDYVDVSHDANLNDIAEQYRYAMTMFRQYESKCETLKQYLVKAAEKQSIKGNGFKVTKYSSRGRVDYDSIPQLLDLDLDIYRKPDTTRYRVTLE